MNNTWTLERRAALGASCTSANNPFPYSENHGGMLFGLPHQIIDI